MELINATTKFLAENVPSAEKVVADVVTNATGDHNSSAFTFAYVLIPVLLVGFALSAFSNVVLLVLIVRAHWAGSPTTLNAYLSSLAIIDLLLSLNQLILLALIFNQGRPIPYLLCYVTLAIQALGRYGIVLLQLAISYNRYHTILNPIHWESSHRKAWITVGVIWSVTFLVALVMSALHIGGVGKDIRYCFWPSLGGTLVALKLALHLGIFACVMAAVAVSVYYHWKTIKLLNENRMILVREMEMASDVKYYQKGQASPEKTTKALVVVFVIQMTTIMIPLTYDIIRVIIMTVNWDRTREASDPSPTVFLLFLTTCGLCATASPFFLMIVSQRFKHNVMDIFKYKPRVVGSVYLKNTKNKTPSIRKERKMQSPRRVHLDMFMCETPPPPCDKYKTNGSDKPDENKEIQSEDFLSDIEEGEVDAWPQCRSPANIDEAAVQCGLVLDNTHARSFFKEDDK